MFQRVWQWFSGVFATLFGSSTTPSTDRPIAAKPEPLEETQYEHYFLQLLDGVDRGWEGVKIYRFFEALSDRATLSDWESWLRRFGDKLLANDGSHRELARRLLRLSDRSHSVDDLRTIRAIAREIGSQLEARAVPAESPPQPQSQSQPEPTPEPEPQPQSEAIETDFWRDDRHATIAALDRQALEVELNRASDLLHEEAFEEALSGFDRVLEADPDNDRAWLERGVALANLGKHKEAIASYDRAIALNPSAAPAWSHRGDAFYDCGEIEAAIASWDRALELKPQDPETWYNKGLALGRNLGRWQEAIAAWDKSLEFKPDDFETWFYRGVGCGALKQWEQALTSWEKTLELKPNFRDAWINKGTALQHLGRYNEAIEANNRAMELQSNAVSE
ncbi:tetratricopeptide repeat protein [Oxynema sp. CENA135]|uniref:tetratricopeptide repeat protein n=1 Tax=Oxynema sp. CENA135 TaxID=984206 RepID=UPI001909820C|nr:tetratricopeptide repeat protein [Oxynema sp. CENA135]MBK4730707.1 tetratricopeptide repeat protein [Oxynema sp. CENA135]